MYHQKCVLSSGGHVPTANRRARIFTGDGLELSRYAKFATNSLRQTATCFGSAHLHRTCGLCSKGDFFLLFNKMQQKLSKLDLEKWATTAWAIWNARKRIYFEHVQVHPKVIFENAMCCLEEYQRLMESQVQRL